MILWEHLAGAPDIAWESLKGKERLLQKIKRRTNISQVKVDEGQSIPGKESITEHLGGQKADTTNKSKWHMRL